MVLPDNELLRQKRQAQGPLIKGGGLLSPKQRPTEAEELTPGEVLTKASLSRITLGQLPRELPDFHAPGSTKDGLIAEWLKQWITSSLTKGTLTESHLLPRKADLAKHLGVSIGTVQNAIRFVEDEGYVESKQRIGTVIRDVTRDDGLLRIRKQTSKRDQAVVAIRHLIVARGLRPLDPMPSAREVARLIGSAPNTTRLALEYLASQGILESQGVRGNKTNWLVQSVPDVADDPQVDRIESETLIDQLERDLKQMVANECLVGDKLASHLELAERFRVSIKTVHDAMKRLSDQGIVHSKRGRYGTYVARKPDPNLLTVPEGLDIFVPVDEVGFYNYQRVEQHLKILIKKNFQVGDKLPAMGKLAEDLDVSSNTIRKALQNLSQEGIVSFSRGRYGGTFVQQLPTDLDDAALESFRWVSINPETAKTYRQSVSEGTQKR
ncbi:MAG: GntR family transcriptional regulator [Candidatus Melainabacteria bacterium]|nr:GntR family transcriptional regulator [Candidatus Melainabacteria bacterium]